MKLHMILNFTHHGEYPILVCDRGITRDGVTPMDASGVLGTIYLPIYPQSY